VTTRRFRAIVLAGERPGGSALARALELPAAVLAPLAGRPCIVRVVDTLHDAGQVEGILLCGPARGIVDASPDLASVLAHSQADWLAPASGPAASALRAARVCQHYPLLLTSGDHGLLSSEVVDTFCRQALDVADAEADEPDVVVGLVSHPQVARAFPQSRRTVLRFADGAFCGSNLFALLTSASGRALEFWTVVEAERKRPWRIALRLGPVTLLRYLCGRLSVDQAFEQLSRRAGCRVRWIPVTSPRAAVDVDSEADWRLADRLLTADCGGTDAGCPT
jgi:CTP:molybdopterin cytidylyltransferase MocA